MDGGILTAKRLDDSLLTFIEGVVPSVWALEALVLLRSEPRQVWSADELVSALRASRPLVDQVLASFETVGLVGREEGGFRYGPPSAVIDGLCEALEAAYRERPVAVVNAIVRRRSDSLGGFSDAFRLKPKP
jgi:hypothetical protein